MSKFFKIFIIFTIIFSFAICISNAETTNLYETQNDNTSFEDENDDLDPLSNTTSNSSVSTYVPASTARVSTVSSIAEANLGLNNILCIILIAIGILIVLLAIAILIRLK